MGRIKKYADAILFVMAALFLVIGFSFYYVKLAGIQNLIIVHFVGGRGADILGNKEDALKMLFAGAGIAIMNVFLAGILWNRSRVMTRIVGIVTLLIALLICIALLAIITVN